MVKCEINSGTSHFYLYFILVFKFYNHIFKEASGKDFYIKFHSSLNCDLFFTILSYD